MRIIKTVLAVSDASCATASLADDFYMFHAPSGNIQCAIMTGDYNSARCDVMEVTKMSFPTQPADCDLDWGHAFEVGSTGAGAPACAGDTVADPSGFVLGYGQSFSKGGFTCQSEKTGMTCTNEEGHGFSVAKAAQKVF